MTLEDVARKAGVSTSTVSRVLSGAGRVRPDTRTRVLKVAEALRYQPDVHARALARGSSHTLGLVVSNLQNPFFLDVFQVAEKDARRRGYDVVVANTDYDPRRLVSSVRWIRGQRLAGLALVVSEKEPALVEDLARGTLPVVFYDVGAPGPHAANIRTNYYRGTRKAVEYLYSLGHRRLAFVGHHPRLQPLLDRRASFLEAVRDHGGTVQFATAAGEDSPDGGRQATRSLFDSGFRPTAIICVNDFMALGVLRALDELGLDVPGDVSVVGYDNIRLSEFARPALTTVDVPRDAIGHAICAALLPEREQAVVKDLVIEPDLVVRDSTGPARPTSRKSRHASRDESPARTR